MKGVVDRWTKSSIHPQQMQANALQGVARPTADAK